MSEKENVGFHGFDLSKTMDLSEQKKDLECFCNEIREDVLRIYPKFSQQKQTIRTGATSLWTVFARENYKEAPHFTLGLNYHEQRFAIALAIPNNAKTEYWKRLQEIINDIKLRQEFLEILKKLRKQTPVVEIMLLHRHYRGQRLSKTDGKLNFNIDTTNFIKTKSDPNVKKFPHWFTAIRELIVNKKGINAHFAVEVHYRHPEEKKKLNDERFAKEAIKVFEYFEELYKFFEPGT